MVFLTRRGGLPKVVEWIVAAAAIILAAVTAYYIFRTGDSGATAVWGSY